MIIHSLMLCKKKYINVNKDLHKPYVLHKLLCSFLLRTKMFVLKEIDICPTYAKEEKNCPITFENNESN